MHVAAVQFKADKGDVRGSRQALCALARSAAQGADLVVLPEMATTGYLFPTREAVARVSEAPDGPTFRALSPIASDTGAVVVCGFAERAGAGDCHRDGEGALYNSAMVIGPDGELMWVYRKRLLYEADEHWATPGDRDYRVLACDAGTFTVGICMDLNDDRFVAWCRAHAPRCVAFPTNWLAEGEPVWPYWAWRLDGSGVALVAANTWGHEGNTEFYGRSAVIDGRTVLAAAPEHGNGIIRARLAPTSP